MPDLKYFKDKVVIVTGSTSGIGLATVKYFSRNGSKVVINGRNQNALIRATQECHCISPSKLTPLAIRGDVTKKEDCKRIISSTINHFGRLDILINNAGAGAFGSITDPKISDTIGQMFDLNVKSLVTLTQLAVEHLERSNGVIINVSSTLSIKPNISFMPYCVAKSAVDMFTKCIALELGPKGIRVNTVNPTAVRTNFQSATGAGDSLNGVLKHLEQVNPLKRISTTEDVVNAIAFLTSSEASFITGHSLVIDGASIFV
ncbi:3-oxoacyl-acyl-carrier-protein reductase-like protein [Sarcoptes scabiei]|uniref:3-oxoacyl-acyl-carrier-protein reductase-like protein n=1 Tax=Sarcoptes scabiei TaxID=52283 RepID=A0A131ZUV5_SARSC|nr:3-oxoacyl-acyl-carrier-protein reductase-like protein [Sarcoptes scabiei]